MARRHALGACPNKGMETPAMGRDDGDMDLQFWDSNEETDSELPVQVAVLVDSEPICGFCASPNPSTLMLSIWPPTSRVDCRLGLRWFLTFAAVCKRAEWTVVDKVSTVRCTEAASWWTCSDLAGFIALSLPMKKLVGSIGIGWRALPWPFSKLWSESTRYFINVSH